MNYIPTPQHLWKESRRMKKIEEEFNIERDWRYEIFFLAFYPLTVIIALMFELQWRRY